MSPDQPPAFNRKKMSNKKAFERWARKNGYMVRELLSEVIPYQGCHLKAGQMVIYTNEQGVEFGPMEILGFSPKAYNGCCVYLDKSSFWYSVRPEQVRVVKR